MKLKRKKIYKLPYHTKHHFAVVLGMNSEGASNVLFLAWFWVKGIFVSENICSILSQIKILYIYIMP